jgi:hypothetical protein
LESENTNLRYIKIMEETPIRDNQSRKHFNAQNRIPTKAKPQKKETQVFKEVANPENMQVGPRCTTQGQAES